MKCAVAIVLALIGIAVANPIHPVAHVAYASPLLLPSAVSVQSSVVNHGITIPKVVVPLVHHTPIYTPIYTVPLLGHGLSLGHSWSYGWGNGWH